MKGTRLYLAVLGILLALSAYLLSSRRSGSYAPAKIEFAVSDTSGVELVRITGNGDLLLSRTGGYWTVNGSRVRKEAITGLSVLISRIEVEAPVSGAIQERIHAGLRDFSTGVSIGMKDGRDKHYQVFYDSLSGSTFMKFKDSDEAFRVRVRGYRQSNLQALYADDPKYWMDNIIFQFIPGDIIAVSLQNNIEPGKSFHLARNEAGKFEIARGSVPGSWSEPDEESLVQYLSYFHDVRFEAFRDTASEKLYDRGEPDYIVSAEGKTGERQTLGLYPVYRLTEGGEKQVDLNMLYGRIGSDGEWIVIKYVRIDPLLQEFEYFK